MASPPGRSACTCQQMAWRQYDFAPPPRTSKEDSLGGGKASRYSKHSEPVGGTILNTLNFLRECAVFDSERDVRRAAIQVLSVTWRNDPQTRRWLHARIASTHDETVRQAAIEALAAGWREHKDTRPLLLERAVSDESSPVRGAALQALSDGWHDEETFLFIRERCEIDQSSEVRETALRALAAKWASQPYGFSVVVRLEIQTGKFDGRRCKRSPKAGVVTRTHTSSCMTLPR